MLKVDPSWFELPKVRPERARRRCLSNMTETPNTVEDMTLFVERLRHVISDQASRSLRTHELNEAFVWYTHKAGTQFWSCVYENIACGKGLSVVALLLLSTWMNECTEALARVGSANSTPGEV